MGTVQEEKTYETVRTRTQYRHVVRTDSSTNSNTDRVEIACSLLAWNYLPIKAKRKPVNPVTTSDDEIKKIPDTQALFLLLLLIPLLLLLLLLFLLLFLLLHLLFSHMSLSPPSRPSSSSSSPLYHRLLRSPARTTRVTISVRFLRAWPFTHHAGSPISTSGNGTDCSGLWKKMQVNRLAKPNNNGNKEQGKEKSKEENRKEERTLRLLRLQGRRWTYSIRARSAKNKLKVEISDRTKTQTRTLVTGVLIDKRCANCFATCRPCIELLPLCPLSIWPTT